MTARIATALLLILAIAAPLAGPSTPARGQIGGMTPGQAKPWGNPGPGIGSGPAPQPSTQPAKVITLTFQRVDAVAEQAAALAQTIDVTYRRDYPSEVLQDLQQRTGLRFASPTPLDKAWLFTLEAKGMTVKDVLQKLADAGQAQVEFKPDLAVLTRKADDKALADLEKKLAAADRWERIGAVWGLSNLGDPRVCPPLVKALKDKDPGVVEWAIRGLEKHIPMVGMISEADRNTIAEALLRWFDKEDFRKQPAFSVAWDPLAQRPPGAAVNDNFDRLRLLAATRRPQAIAALVQYLNAGKEWSTRYAVALALGEFGQAATDLRQVMRDAGPKFRAAEQKQRQAMADWQAQIQETRKNGGDLSKVTPPPAMNDPAAFQLRALYGSTLAALVMMRDPEGMAEACRMVQTDPAWFMIGPDGSRLRRTRDPQVLDLIVPRLIEAKIGRASCRERV
jgi:hypothetical protein